jgi:hypothetical protein
MKGAIVSPSVRTALEGNEIDGLLSASEHKGNMRAQEGSLAGLADFSEQKDEGQEQEGKGQELECLSQLQLLRYYSGLDHDIIIRLLQRKKKAWKKKCAGLAHSRTKDAPSARRVTQVIFDLRVPRDMVNGSQLVDPAKSLSTDLRGRWLLRWFSCVPRY